MRTVNSLFKNKTKSRLSKIDTHNSVQHEFSQNCSLTHFKPHFFVDFPCQCTVLLSMMPEEVKIARCFKCKAGRNKRLVSNYEDYSIKVCQIQFFIAFYCNVCIVNFLVQKQKSTEI